MSNGRGYYRAGETYTFTVDVLEPTATAWTDITDIRLLIPDGTNILLIADIDAAGTPSVTVSTGNVTAVMGISGTWNNFTLTFNVTFRWDTTGSAWAASRNIVASSSGSALTNTKAVSYGIITSMRFLNFAQSGVATDGYVNQYFTTFQVTGTVVWNIPGASTSDAVTAGLITASRLYLNGVNIGIANSGTTNNPVFNVTNAIAASMLLNNTWTINITSPDAPAVGETSTNNLSLIRDEVQVNSIEIIGGGGNEITAVPNGVYYRSFLVPGTQIRVNAQMRYTGGGLIGNTTITVTDITDTLTYDITIPNGSTQGTLAIANPTNPGSGGTLSHTYRATAIAGGITDDEQNTYAEIRQPANGLAGANTIVYWDNGDPPGNNGSAFTTGPTHSTTAGTLTINWGGIAVAHPDRDFDTYKIYYREQGAPTWTIIDRTSGAAFTNLNNSSTGTTTIDGLKPLTTYEYIISAVDIFGNEVALADRLTPVINPATGPASVTITLTDSITSYNDSSFNGDPDPSLSLKLRKSAIRADFTIITAGTVPSSVDLILANNASDVVADYGSGATDLITDLPLTEVYSIPCQNMGPNKWTAFIPSDHLLMTVGGSVRFILKVTYNAGISYLDHDSEGEAAPGFPEDNEWRFYIYDEPVFTPWPVRILNNVITEKNPIAYPSYYLTDDAYVTITAYDIKGRVVALLLDNAFRKAGQNIKEQGWRGTNKSNKKLGVGLYYIHVEAKRASDGKTIINTFKKVVMAR
ncbi:MAG TPA: fibronectin type III domain-containing protein [Spirochaetota bacterium]|nr:fibronectin type III domain-containing protein [Spirochaetota bacterium]